MSLKGLHFEDIDEMLNVKTITRKLSDFRMIMREYAASFPKSEQAPAWFLLMRAKKDNIMFLAYYDNDAPVGLAYYVLHSGITYVVYLAVCGQNRSMGYGSRILSHIKESHPDNRMVLCIEMLNEKANNNEQRKKRKQFYEKNGFASAGLIVKQRGDFFEILAQGGGCTMEEFDIVSKIFIGSAVYRLFKPMLMKDSKS